MPTAPDERDEISRLIDLDEAYDTDPCGEPPLLVARYRASLRAALAAGPAGPDNAPASWSDREHEAYLAGGQATLRAVVGVMAAALVDHRPARPPALE